MFLKSETRVMHCPSFALGHSVISRGVSRMEWADVGSCWSNEVVS